jgi:hypothetical protein
MLNNASLIQQSRAHPREIMIEVLKSLHELNVRWKKNGHYNMKCMWCPGFPQVSDNGDANGRLPVVIKFEIQVCYFTSNIKLILFQRKEEFDLLLNIVFTSWILALLLGQRLTSLFPISFSHVHIVYMFNIVFVHFIFYY